MIAVARFTIVSFILAFMNDDVVYNASNRKTFILKTLSEGKANSQILRGKFVKSNVIHRSRCWEFSEIVYFVFSISIQCRIFYFRVVDLMGDVYLVHIGQQFSGQLCSYSSHRHIYPNSHSYHTTNPQPK